MPPFIHHPHECMIRGPSGSGKTTLVCKLLERWSKRFRPVFVKHTKHDLEIDQPGKDTFRAREAGAAVITAEGPNRAALILRKGDGELPVRLEVLEADFAVVEGFRSQPMPQVVMLDEARSMIPVLQEEADAPVVACVGPWPEAPAGEPLPAPYFHRDDVEGIKQAVEETLFRPAPLFGLVLAGGHSRRMGTDKASLRLHGRPQAEHVHALLQPFCEQVFLSNRKEQTSDEGHEGLPQLHDVVEGAGPLGGVLSALKTHPEAAWLITACDLPYLTEAVLEKLVKGRHPLKMATAFKSRFHEGFAEPLCTIYEPKSLYRLSLHWARGQCCPRKILKQSPVALLEPPEDQSLENMNRPEDLEAAREVL